MKAAPAPTDEVVVVPVRDRYTRCASCPAAARWQVSGPRLALTTACDRHRPTWMRRAKA